MKNKFQNKSLDECLEIALVKKLNLVEAFQLANRVQQLAPTPHTIKQANKSGLTLK
jgi:hypothetical protein